MNHSELAMLQKQNRRLTILLAIVLTIALVSAAASVMTLVVFLDVVKQLKDALSQLDVGQINEALDTISALTDLMNRISNIFG